MTYITPWNIGFSSNIMGHLLLYQTIAHSLPFSGCGEDSLSWGRQKYLVLLSFYWEEQQDFFLDLLCKDQELFT